MTVNERPAEAQRAKAVLCLSGGMDSCVCATVAAKEYDVYALHFSYGQRTETRELASAKAVAELTGAKEFLPLRMDLFRRIGGIGSDGRQHRCTGVPGGRECDREQCSGNLRAVPQRAFPVRGP